MPTRPRPKPKPKPTPQRRPPAPKGPKKPVAYGGGGGMPSFGLGSPPASVPVAYGGGGGMPPFGLGSVPPKNRPVTSTFIGGGGDFVRGFFGEGVPIGQAQEYGEAVQEFLSGGGNLGDGGGGFGGGLGGGGGLSVPEGPAELPDISTIKWKQGNFNLQDSRAPSWWKSLVPENAADMERPDVAYIAMLNTMIPYLSPEDQKRAAGLIYATVGGANFGHYEQVDVQAPITQATANLSRLNLPVIDTQYYQSASRGSGAVNALSQLREQTVGGEREKIGGTGIGYRFLQDLLAQVQQFGGKAGEGQTRSQQLAMQGALDPLFAQLNSPEIGPVGAIAQMLGTPFFSQGSLSPFTRQGNKVFFGQPNPVLY